MQLVILTPGEKGGQSTYKIDDIGLLPLGGKHLRRYIEEAAKVLDGRPGYLAFDMGDEAVLRQMFQHFVDTESVPSEDLARLITDTTCSNRLHAHRVQVHAHANFFTVPQYPAFKGFKKGKNNTPLAIWINIALRA